jgi:hypothetical protein
MRWCAALFVKLLQHSCLATNTMQQLDTRAPSTGHTMWEWIAAGANHTNGMKPANASPKLPLSEQTLVCDMLLFMTQCHQA